MTAAVAARPPRVGTALAPEYVAYEEYLDHQKQCRQCSRSLFVCPTGADLWEAFKARLPGSR